MKTMHEWVAEYLRHRRNLGYILRVEGKMLEQFARFWDGGNYKFPLTIPIAVRWATLPVDVTKQYKSRRLDYVRQFTRYLVIFDPLTEIPPQGMLGPSRRRNNPYIFSDTEIKNLMAEAKALPGKTKLRGSTYQFMIGLLGSTGIRIGELLRLTRDDVDLSGGFIRIHQSKGHQGRRLPLRKSTIKSLDTYSKMRDKIIPLPKDNAFFLAETGKRPHYNTVCYTFRSLCLAAGINPVERRRPRLHDLRHTFACKRLLLWYESGADVEKSISYLSVYLGHKTLRDTYWYLTGTPQLLALCGTRFENYANCLEDKK